MPRKNINLDKILHESSKSAFEAALPIPMYVSHSMVMTKVWNFLTKFGVRSSDTITLQMSCSQFTASYSPSLSNSTGSRTGGADLDRLVRPMPVQRKGT